MLSGISNGFDNIGNHCSKVSAMNILNLPNKVLVYTLSFLERKNLENCLLTCKRFRECTYQNLWKELFQGLTTRTIEKFIDGPYLGLIGDYVMPIGLKVAKLEDIQIFSDKLKQIEKRVKIWAIEMLSSLSHENFLKIFSLSTNLLVFKAYIESFDSLNYFLELVKSNKIEVILSVKIVSKTELDLWKENLKKLPEAVELYGLDCSDFILNCGSTDVKIRDICKTLKVKSLSLGGICTFYLDLSECGSLVEVKVSGVYGIGSNLILPKQLKSLAISAYLNVWNGVLDCSNCRELSRLDLVGSFGQKILLSQNIKDTVNVISKKKDEEPKIEWV